mmetsp:Transcript_26407/g.40026  ORF Transcript_26407/g.40026 Transcript_26407/m.40026 type:complete len:325 (-) Transcript_26407:89-1063(-)|eukprot:CAMPEP_0178917836 /NCGR_PEP_ID=MMETSP0786-20121207/13480_1 /TAXON_ID=186022 /ORGANISM="Thalassionema frauenfeldii, Strain CCMP 1798" /LENGTH=324 /DNA_ID=CAMNT_0020591455 /DNA_START=39 /DNA_END=1013 /DNA_ORIENTATION=-
MSDNNAWPTPSFYGNRMPNVKIDNDDDIGEETTRRVAFTPSVTPIAPTSLNRNETHMTCSSPWKLTTAPTVPAFGHPLEPTSVLVQNTTASVIANRVSQIIERIGTIEVEYIDNQAECKTCDNIEFGVFLYSDGGDGIIVEVQLLYGNSFSFYSTVTKVILDGVQEENVAKTAKNESLPVVNDVDEVPSLDFAISMLRQAESQQLGLEILCSLTDSRKSCGTSEKVSQLLVSNKEFLTLIFEMVQQEELRMPSLMLLRNISKCGAMIPMVQELVQFLRSSQAQVVYLALQCLRQSSIEIEEEARRHVEQLGQEKHHKELASLVC